MQVVRRWLPATVVRLTSLAECKASRRRYTGEACSTRRTTPCLSLGSQIVSSSAKQRGQSPKEISGGGNPQRCPFSDGFRKVLGVVSE